MPLAPRQGHSTRSSTNRPYAHRLAIGAGTIIFALLWTAPKVFPKSIGRDSNGGQTAAAKDAAQDYVGAETCKTCHEEQFDHFARTAHAKLINLPGWTAGNQGCEPLFQARAGVLLPPVFTSTLDTSLIRYRQLLNTIEADYRLHPQFSAHIGYRFGHRRIEHGDESELDVTHNRTHVVLGGFRARPVKVWTVYFDAQHGTADNVFTRVANYDITNVRVRNTLKAAKTLTLNASVVTKDNTNPSLTLDVPPQNFGVTIKSRIVTSSLDWTPNGNMAVSAGYTHTHVDSNAAIVFFLNFVKRQGTSLYSMRDNAPRTSERSPAGFPSRNRFRKTPRRPPGRQLRNRTPKPRLFVWHPVCSEPGRGL